ncbi:response regulator [Pleurocapsales cyanobacterium LEGE 10410]|nr:response regulator [Pleurocapsales cyanobacterium LEGE 10410]
MPAKSILLVEDNPDDRELMTLAFVQQEFTYNLIIVSDGLEALDYLFGIIPDDEDSDDPYGDRDLTSMPALIMLDLNLPRVNGIEILRQIRADPRTRLIPVVIISSSDEPQDLIDSYINGCNSYVRKPIDFTQLQNFVREVSSYWLTVNQLPPVFGVLNE